MSQQKDRSSTSREPQGPLVGLRVLDCANVLAGPAAAQILGDFGADVIKIEHPEGGDSLRGHGASKDGVSLWWKVFGRNKRTLGLNLGEPEGAAILRKLAASADVLIESFRPGTFERWGLGWDVLHEINARLVFVRVTGFGQEGPYAGRPAFGTLIEAMSGFAAMSGDPDGPPMLPPFGLADGVAGIAGALAACMALYQRDARGGVGQVIDLAILDPLVSVLGPQATIFGGLGLTPVRTGNRSSNNAPRNIYQTADGHWVAISTSTLEIARRVMRLVGHPEVVDQPWFSTGAGRVTHVDELDAAVAEWIRARPRTEVMEAFTGANAAAAPVYDVTDLVNDPQVQHRETITAIVDPDLGELLMPNVLFRLADTPGSIRFAGRALGSDTDAVLTEAGMNEEELRAARERGIIV